MTKLQWEKTPHELIYMAGGTDCKYQIVHYDQPSCDQWALFEVTLGNVRGEAWWHKSLSAAKATAEGWEEAKQRWEALTGREPEPVKPAPDVIVHNHGSLVVVHPKTEAAEAWVAEHIPGEAMRWAGGVVVEPRYVEPILVGMHNDGLAVEVQ